MAEMTAEQFHEAFRFGWIAAGKDANTREFQLATMQAYSSYLRLRGVL